LYILKVTPYSNSFDASTLDTHIYTFENQKEEKFPFVDHWVFKVFNVPAEVLKSKTMLNAVFGKFCNLHKLKVVDQKVTSFKKQGFTITYILASSNLLIHTWPEYNALHIDLITCSPIYSKETMVKSLSELLKTKSIEASNIE
jgi:S-adenosylmethionine/arginine decarboxylase-like enzyme